MKTINNFTGELPNLVIDNSMQTTNNNFSGELINLALNK